MQIIDRVLLYVIVKFEINYYIYFKFTYDFYFCAYLLVGNVTYIYKALLDKFLFNRAGYSAKHMLHENGKILSKIILV